MLSGQGNSLRNQTVDTGRKKQEKISLGNNENYCTKTEAPIAFLKWSNDTSTNPYTVTEADRKLIICENISQGDFETELIPSDFKNKANSAIVGHSEMNDRQRYNSTHNPDIRNDSPINHNLDGNNDCVSNHLVDVNKLDYQTHNSIPNEEIMILTSLANGDISSKVKYVKVKLKDKEPYSALIDTGSSANIMGYGIFRANYTDIEIIPIDITLRAYRGEVTPLLLSQKLTYWL